MIEYILLFILGKILGFILYYHYINRYYNYHGPKSSYVKKIIFNKNNKNYKFKTEVKVCPISIF